MYLYLISQCQGFVDGKYIFHFKGTYKGDRVSQVVLEGPYNLEKGKNYFILLKGYEVLNGNLKGKILKFKNLSNFEKMEWF